MTDFESRTADRLPCSEALLRILDSASSLNVEEVALDDAMGRALAEDVTAPGTLPPWDSSAMDGYAVRGADVEGATEEHPVVLSVAGAVLASTRFDGPVGDGQAVRIMTGGPVPDGADTVIRVEDTDREAAAEGSVAIRSDRDRGRHVRPAGKDWSPGDTVLERGTGIGPGHIGVLAAARMARVRVYRMPSVAILASGGELQPLDASSLDPDRIPESNGHMIGAAVRAAGATPLLLGIAEDDAEDIRAYLGRASDADVLVTIGGASMGEGDLFKRVLDDAGFQQAFWRARMRPGSPVSFGHLPREGRPAQAVFGLPGNPASAFVTFEVFVRPFLRALAGHSLVHRPAVSAIAGDELRTSEGLTYFLRVRLERREGITRAFLTGPQGSGLVRSLALADGLAVVPEGVAAIPEGSPVEVVLLDDAGGFSDRPPGFG